MTSGVAQILLDTFRRFTNGDREGAIALARTLLGENSGHADVLNLNALLERETGNFELALRHADAAILVSPSRGDLHFTRGLVLRSLQRKVEAVAEFREAIRLQPSLADAHNCLGVTLMELGDVDAQSAFMEAIRLQPRNADYWVNIGNLFKAAGRLDDAAQSYAEAIACQPRHALAHQQLGIVRLEQHRAAEAASCFSGAISAQGPSAPLHNWLGIAQLELQQWDAAEASFSAALALAPSFLQARANLGGMLAQWSPTDPHVRQLLEEAIKDEALAATAHLSLANACLRSGACEEGFAHYRWRRLESQHPQSPPSGQSLPPAVSNCVVFGEQGLGDTLFFLRFLPVLRERVGKLSFAGDPRLFQLLATSGVFENFYSPNDPVPDDAARILCGDLPGQADLANLPGPLQLRPDSATLHEVSSLLSQAGSGRSLALTWRAGVARSRYDAKNLSKSAPLDLLCDFLRSWPGPLIVVQRDPEPAELSLLRATFGSRLVDLSRLNVDLMRIFAVMALVDEYVCVSNTNVHLRAAAGRSSHVLVPFPGEWRWPDGGLSPWFAGTNVFHEHRVDGWSRLADFLRPLLQRAPAGEQNGV